MLSLLAPGVYTWTIEARRGSYITFYLEYINLGWISSPCRLSYLKSKEISTNKVKEEIFEFATSSLCRKVSAYVQV